MTLPPYVFRWKEHVFKKIIYVFKVFIFMSKQTYSRPSYMHSFSQWWSTVVLKYLMENSRKRQCIRFHSYAFLSSVMRSRAFLPCPMQAVKHPFVHHVHPLSATPPVSHSIATLLMSLAGTESQCLCLIILYLILTPKLQSRDVTIWICQREAIECFLTVKRYVSVGKW